MAIVRGRLRRLIAPEVEKRGGQPHHRTIVVRLSRQPRPRPCGRPETDTTVEHELRTDLIAAFARAVARPGGDATLLDRSNNVVGRQSLEAVVTSGQPFFVAVASDVLAVDSDDPARQAVLFDLAGCMRADGVNVVVVASGQPGHFHLFARFADADLHRRYVVRAKSARFDVRRDIRPPLAPHRLGLPVRLVDPEDPAEALAALSRTSWRALSPALENLVRHGDREGRYPGKGGRADRSRIVMAIVMGAVHAGWTVEEAFHVLYDRTNRGGEKVQARKPLAARRYVEATWTKAVEKIEQTRRRALGEVAVVRAAIERTAWPGAAGVTDRKVLEAHLIIAGEVGTQRYSVSVRRIAELAGRRAETVSKAHRRLCERGLLVIVKKGTAASGAATVWSLTVPAEPVRNRHSSDRTCSHPTARSRPVHVSSGLGGDEACAASRPPRDAEGPGADVWRRGGLEGSAWRVWGELGDLPLPVAQLATSLRLPTRTVRRHLARLASLMDPLAVQDDAGRWRRGPGTLEAAAIELGVLGSAAAQRTRHAVERNVFRRRTRLTATADNVCQQLLARWTNTRVDAGVEVGARP